jgi:hypothetical protein
MVFYFRGTILDIRYSLCSNARIRNDSNIELSTLCSFAHCAEEFRKNLVRIMRTWRGLRVELDAVNRLVFQAHTLQRTVIQAQVGHFDLVRVERFRHNHVIVILGGNVNLLRAQILHRMIPAMMSELESRRLAAQGPANQLVTETNAENRRFALD